MALIIVPLTPRIPVVRHQVRVRTPIQYTKAISDPRLTKQVSLEPPTARTTAYLELVKFAMNMTGRGLRRSRSSTSAED